MRQTRRLVLVTAEGRWWPDYPGNNVFNSLGNLAETPAAALLFIDLALAVGEEGHAGRRVRSRPNRSSPHTSRPPPIAKGEIVSDQRPPLPPFDLDSAFQKVQAAEDAWNTRDPHHVSLAYTPDSVWRNRDQFLTGRRAIVEFLTAKWDRELDYALRKSLWGFRGNRMAVRFQYEWHDAAGQWYRSYGNELWEFDDNGLMRRREASINDLTIAEADRRYFGPRAENERGAEHGIPMQ